jgi:hypothetical protein
MTNGKPGTKDKEAAGQPPTQSNYEGMVNMEMIQISATLNFMGSTLTHVTFDREEFFKLAAAGKVDLDPIYTQAENHAPSVVPFHPTPTGSGNHDIRTPREPDARKAHELRIHCTYCRQLETAAEDGSGGIGTGKDGVK